MSAHDGILPKYFICPIGRSQVLFFHYLYRFYALLGIGGWAGRPPCLPRWPFDALIRRGCPFGRRGQVWLVPVVAFQICAATSWKQRRAAETLGTHLGPHGEVTQVEWFIPSTHGFAAWVHLVCRGIDAVCSLDAARTVSEQGSWGGKISPK